MSRKQQKDLNMQSSAEIAWAILHALDDSSFAEEMECYREDVQQDLGLTDETMERLFNYTSLIAALKPRKEQKSPVKQKSRDRKKKDAKNTKRVASPEHSAVTETKQPAETADGAAVIKALRKLLKKKLKEMGLDKNAYKTLTYDTETYEKALLLTGDTKPVKDAIKACGGKWNGAKKGWIFSKNNILKAAGKVTDSPKEAPKASPKVVAKAVAVVSSVSSDEEEDDEDDVEDDVEDSDDDLSESD